MLVTSIFSFSNNVFKTLLFPEVLTVRIVPGKGLNIHVTRRQILDSSNLKEFADDSFKFDENGKELSKWVENTVGKGEIACY